MGILNFAVFPLPVDWTVEVGTVLECN